MKIPIKVVEGKDRRPKMFEYNGAVYDVENSDMCSFQLSPEGNMGFKVICKVKGQKKPSTIWLNGDEWFVEIKGR